MTHPLNKIVNPETGYRVDIDGAVGRRVLGKYLENMRGGKCSGFFHKKCDTCEEVNHQHPTCTNCDVIQKRRTLRNKLCNNTPGCRMNRNVTDPVRLAEIFPPPTTRTDTYECVRRG